MRYEAVLTEAVHRQTCDRLLKEFRAGRSQEALCFGLWRPGTGAKRLSALVFDFIPPVDGEVSLHGNASFEPHYLTRAVKEACSRKAGLAFMHNHLTPGWQDMSATDVVAERDRIAPPARATGFPLVGLTLGTDGAWSARFWSWDGDHFRRDWCEKVRVVGRRMQVTCNDTVLPPPRRRPVLTRTIDTWGEIRQRDIGRLRIGVVGLGSVGCIIAEALARIGIGKLVLIDPDRIETHNLDRLLYAGAEDVGKRKVDLVATHVKRNATAEAIEVETHASAVQHRKSYRAALDCDLLFSAVDRPLPKDLLNRIAYTHCIPVISGGVRIENKPNGSLANALWSVAVVGPHRRCLRCDGQYASSDVIIERDGSLDDPSYFRRQGAPQMPSNQNVFPFGANVASFMVIEMVRLLTAEPWWPDLGGKMSYSLIVGRLCFDDARCIADCSVMADIAAGDTYDYPFIDDDTEKRAVTSISSLLRQTCRHVQELLRRIGRKD